jgi:hypothetical protein
MNQKNNKKDLVSKIKALAEEYLSYIEDLNECAYTDAILEQLVKASTELNNNLF